MIPEESPVPSHRIRLGRTIRSLRRAQGRTLRATAGDLGLSAATLSGIENGRTGVSTERLGQLAATLGVPVGRLLDGTEEPEPATTPPSSLPGDGWRDFSPLTLDDALTGALSAFVQYGYHGATMRIVAERAGLSVPGLYHHYAGKQQMLVALLDLTMHDLHRRTTEAVAEADDPVGQLSRVVECLALFHTHRRELAFLGASEMRSLEVPARARVATMRVEEQRLVDSVVASGVLLGVFATGRPHQAARAVVTSCTALSQWFRADGPDSPEEVAEQYVDFALDLVRSATRPSRPDAAVAAAAPDASTASAEPGHSTARGGPLDRPRRAARPPAAGRSAAGRAASARKVP